MNILDEEAYQLIFDLVSPEVSESKYYAELVQKLDEHFKSQQSALRRDPDFTLQLKDRRKRLMNGQRDCEDKQLAVNSAEN